MNAIRNILNFSNTYELPIARTYVRHWGMQEAVREIIQNALDSESPFEYEFEGSELRIHSRNSHLAPETLLLGKTSKADDKDSIGSFGEGYKIALLVLAREGYDVDVLNGDRIWRPCFRYSNTFKTDVLCIEDSPAPRRNEGLSFIIGNLTPEEIAGIKNSCLYMQDNVGPIIETAFGKILRDRRGKLYVGSLFICNTQLMFGYDVKPEFLTLERDRQTVSTFDLQMLTKDMWFDSERWEEIATLMEAETPDLSYAEYGAPQMVKEACYRLFRRKHPEGIIVKDQKELEAYVEKGMTNTVYCGSPYGSIVRSHADYVAKAPAVATSPESLLRQWFSAHRGEMRKDAIVTFKLILQQASGWRFK